MRRKPDTSRDQEEKVEALRFVRELLQQEIDRLQTPNADVKELPKRDNAETETVREILSKVRAAMRQKKLTYEQVGERLGVHKAVAQSTLSRLFSANSRIDPQLGTVLGILKALNLKLKDIL